MPTQLLILMIGRLTSTLLISKGEEEIGGLLNDALTAYRLGKPVDDILQALSDKWDAEGAPSYDDIAAHRKSIQERIG